MGAWFSSRSQPLSFNTNEYELHHGYKKPLKDNKNNTRRNRNGYNFLGARLKHNHTRKYNNKQPAFITLLTNGVVPNRNITNYTAPSYPNIPSIPNVVITGNRKRHRTEKLQGLFEYLLK